MYNVDLNREFEDIGNKMKTIAILTFISFIANIVGLFLFIVTVISWVMQIIILIFFLLVIGDIKRAGKILDYNKQLLGFPLKFILGTILRLIGLIGFFGIGVFIIMSIDKLNRFILVIFFIVILIGIGFIIVGSILRMLAWIGLRTFFGDYAQLFPLSITDDGRTGANLCKIGCILDMISLVPILGDIFRIFGYFRLASLQRLTGTSAQTTYQPSPPLPIQTPVEAPTSNYCSNCGSDLRTAVRFCPRCGVEID